MQRILQDPSWVAANLQKLSTFYFSALLPELACPRHHKGGIREPSFIHYLYIAPFHTFMYSISYSLINFLMNDPSNPFNHLSHHLCIGNHTTTSNITTTGNSIHNSMQMSGRTVNPNLNCMSINMPSLLAALNIFPAQYHYKTTTQLRNISRKAST